MRTYDIKHKWLTIIDNMTHEHCLWYDPESSPQFYTLDQTEGPNRERRRLRKTHLNIDRRFFKECVKHKLDNEQKQNKFDYLLKNEEDHSKSSILNNNNNNNNNYDGIVDSLTFYLKKPEHMQ